MINLVRFYLLTESVASSKLGKSVASNASGESGVSSATDIYASGACMYPNHQVNDSDASSML